MKTSFIIILSALCIFINARCTDTEPIITCSPPPIPNESYLVNNTSTHNVQILLYPQIATLTVQKIPISQGSSTQVAYVDIYRKSSSSGLLISHLERFKLSRGANLEYKKAILVFSDNKKIEYSFPCSPASLEGSPKNLLCRKGFVETNRITIDSGPCGIVTTKLEYTYTITKEDYQRAK